MVHPHNSGFALNFFKKILHIERDQQVDENNINVFSKKNLVWGKWTILCTKMVHPHNSRSELFFKFCRVKGVNR